MPSDLATAAVLVASLLTTYLAHSTLFLGSVWLLLRIQHIPSAALRERLWKGAALAGLLTTPLQFAVNGSDQQSAVSVQPEDMVQGQERDERGETRDESRADELVLGPEWEAEDHDTSLPSSFFRPPSSILHPPSSSLSPPGATGGLSASVVEETSSDALAVPPWSGILFDELLIGDDSMTSPYEADLSGETLSRHNNVEPIAPLTPDPSPAWGEGSDDDELPESSRTTEFVQGPESDERREVRDENWNEEFVVGPQLETSGHEPSSPSSIFHLPSSSLRPPSSVLRLPATLLRPAAGLLLALCVACGALRFAAQSFRFLRRVRRCTMLEAGPARESLDALLHKLRIKKPVALVADADGAMPAAFGLRRWRILVPANVHEQFTRGELDALLAHELAHLVRGDGWWLLFGRLLCSLGLFQPLNLIARREWQRASEWQCDEWALEQQVDPLALARCLTRVAEWSLRRASFAPAMGAVGLRSQLGERVERLIERPADRDLWKGGLRRWMSLAAIFTAVALVACFAPRATFSAATVTDEVTSDSASGGRQSPVDVALGASDDRLQGIGPQASGSSTTASSPSSILDLPSSFLPPTGATGGLSASAYDPSVLKEQHALQQELHSLDEEIRSLDDTLRAAGANEEMADLLDRLRARLAALRARREILHEVEVQLSTPHESQLPPEEK